MAKDQYAFPIADPEIRNLGMSLRQYLTAQALTGLLAHRESSLVSQKELAQAAVTMADATLEALQCPRI